VDSRQCPSARSEAVILAGFLPLRQTAERPTFHAHSNIDDPSGANGEPNDQVGPTRHRRFFSSWLAIRMLRNAFSVICVALLVKWLSILPWMTSSGRADHVIIVVWDGLRPDMVNSSNTPTLYKLSQTGSVFTRHHPVYPSLTEVNGTALATGMYPGKNRIIGNHEYRPEIKPYDEVSTESLSVVRIGDKISDGKYIGVPTMYETVQADGISTAIAGAKPIALLPDRSIARVSSGATKSVDVFAGETLPPEILPGLEQVFGKFPERPTFPDVGQNKWTTDVLLEALWKGPVAKLSLLWLSDPDYSQHDSQPGSSEALASLKVNDDLLARLLATLEAKGLRDTTDILLVSDHGFSTVGQAVDYVDLLSKGGFHAYRKFLQKPNPGDIMVVSNGGSVFLYVIGHDKADVQHLVTFLMGCESCGVIFSKEVLPGTFPLASAHLDSPEAPDVIVALKWNDSPNASGVKGMIFADRGSNHTVGQGMHGSLSPYDMHNTLIAAGPDFRAGYIDTLPSGNVDIAPTVLSILGVKPSQKLDGRILREALVSSRVPDEKANERTLNATSDINHWSQTLKIVSVNGTEYFDEGRAGQSPHNNQNQTP
jgi:arylsulfatase A-like enzyme